MLSNIFSGNKRSRPPRVPRQAWAVQQVRSGGVRARRRGGTARRRARRGGGRRRRHAHLLIVNATLVLSNPVYKEAYSSVAC